MSQSDGILSPTPYSDADSYWSLLGDIWYHRPIQFVSSLPYFRVIPTIEYCYNFFWTQSVSDWRHYGNHIWFDTRMNSVGPGVYVIPLYYKNEKRDART